MKGFHQHRKIVSLVLALSLASWEMTAFAQAVQAEEKPIQKGGLSISELMVKNHATRLNEKGDIADYIEIANLSGETVSLEGLCLSDDSDELKWSFPAGELLPGEHILILADKGESAGDELHCNFALSHGETVYLTDSSGALIDEAVCGCDTADIALVSNENGDWQESLYPSPGFPNSQEGYEKWQETLAHTSALIINEAMVLNHSYLRQNHLGFCDWLEIKNVSDSPVELSDYYLSDDDDFLSMWSFPESLLEPGECLSVICDDSSLSANQGQLKAPFKLNSQRERIYLSHIENGLSDSIFLRDIPYGCSYGRAEGENGGFFFDSPSPGEDNGRGCRRISAMPRALTADGVFDQGGIELALEGEGKIYYTTDGSLPTKNSERYKNPLTVDETCIIRAVCIEQDAIPSRPLTLSYIIGQEHSLPVLSLVTDKESEFWRMYNGKRKDMEVPGSLALYEEGGSFTVPCGIEMHGETSLELPKKNMSVKLSGAYGMEEVEYDVFGGGVTRFSDFILRSGQDYSATIVRSELLQNLCMQYSDSVPNQRSKYCVLYINGEYSGIYALMEKLNEQHYANHTGVSPDSVLIYKAVAPESSAFYQEVIVFAQRNDLSDNDAYERFCQIVDIDSLIDWLIIEGYSVNSDISNGNVRYCRSDEDDGKWRFMLYDLDSTMSSPYNSFNNVLTPKSTQCAEFVIPLMKNEVFRDRFLSRAAEVLGSTLSDENVVMELERLADIIRDEVERDYARFGMKKYEWEYAVSYLHTRIVDEQWSKTCQNSLKRLFKLSDSEMEHYFGD